MPVKDVHVKRWGVKEEMLWEAGVANGMRLLPAEFITMRNALRECMFQKETAGPGRTFCLIRPGTETRCMSCPIRSEATGRPSIVYPHILEMIGSILRDDFYVLPSSVHEVVIVPASAGDPFQRDGCYGAGDQPDPGGGRRSIKRYSIFL